MKKIIYLFGSVFVVYCLLLFISSKGNDIYDFLREKPITIKSIRHTVSNSEGIILVDDKNNLVFISSYLKRRRPLTADNHNGRVLDVRDKRGLNSLKIKNDIYAGYVDWVKVDLGLDGDLKFGDINYMQVGDCIISFNDVSKICGVEKFYKLKEMYVLLKDSGELYYLGAEDSLYRISPKYINIKQDNLYALEDVLVIQSQAGKILEIVGNDLCEIRRKFSDGMDDQMEKMFNIKEQDKPYATYKYNKKYPPLEIHKIIVDEINIEGESIKYINFKKKSWVEGYFRNNFLISNSNCDKFKYFLNKENGEPSSKAFNIYSNFLRRRIETLDNYRMTKKEKKELKLNYMKSMKTPIKENGDKLVVLTEYSNYNKKLIEGSRVKIYTKYFMYDGEEFKVSKLLDYNSPKHAKIFKELNYMSEKVTLPIEKYDRYYYWKFNDLNQRICFIDSSSKLFIGNITSASVFIKYYNIGEDLLSKEISLKCGEDISLIHVDGEILVFR